jgi:hypothetical protein
MNRRTILKNLSLITGGAVFLPSCNFLEEKATIALKNLDITAKQEELVAEMVGVIVPRSDIPGAKELKVQNFLWIMVDDMLNASDQETFINGLDSFDKYSRDVGGRAFHKLDRDKQEQLIKHILTESSADSNDINFFVRYVQEVTVYGYLHTKYIMTEVMPYTLVPGSFEACKTIDHSTRINIYG